MARLAPDRRTRTTTGIANVEPINVGVLGLGTVGAGVVNLLEVNGEEITRRAGRSIRVTHAAVRDLNRERDCDTDNIRLTDRPRDVVEDPAVDIVLELIGGDTQAYDLVMAAIE